MGQVRQPKPVLLVVAISSQFSEAMEWADAKLVDEFGALFSKGPAFQFDHTAFYQKTMGQTIAKQVVAFQDLIDPGQLAAIKNRTNELEQQYTKSHSHDCERPINLDPGYITEAKLVLATVKNRDHRIYIGQGIYAEVTLSYYGKQWNGSRWTYPDYLTDDNLAFFTQCRSELRRKMSLRAATNVNE